MTNYRYLFFNNLAQTSSSPIALEIVKAKGVYLFDVNNKKYLDAISGINVSYVGHCNDYVIEKIYDQLNKYSHLMVYGELIQSPQIRYLELLISFLPNSLNNIYFTNSGSEAVEAAMKLSKRYTRRTKIISFKNSYHGSSQGALSIMGSEYWRNSFRPLLPDVFHLNFNENQALNFIDNDTACVIMEVIQAESGILAANKDWLEQISDKCKQHNALLIFDEIQSGFGRTGKMWAFEHYGITPDVLLLGKSLGGGLPLGALISEKKIMHSFTSDPVLGHITTFGGNPISCEAGLASLEYFLRENILAQLEQKIHFFKKCLSKLNSEKIVSVNQFGLWASIKLSSQKTCLEVVENCLHDGLFIDWFLFASDSIRIAPPLVINQKGIEEIFKILKSHL